MSQPIENQIDPTPYVNLDNVDLTVLTLINEHYKDAKDEGFTLNGKKVTHLNIQVRSNLLNHDPQLHEYNILYKSYDSSNKTEADLKVYHEGIKHLNKRVSDRVRGTFMRCINPETELGSRIVNHFDTLLFAALFFYDKFWDAYGTDFAGKVSLKNSLSDLEFHKQPYFYRAHQQVIYISTLLYNYYKSGLPPTEIHIISNRKAHVQKDPILTRWVMKSLVESILNDKLPVSTDYYGDQLKGIISKLNYSIDNEALNQLKNLSESKPPVFVNIKRKVVRQFCLELHKVFCYYTGLNVKTFTIPQLIIYTNILKEFGMDNFETHKRKPGSESKKSRNFLPQERLRELLMRDEAVSKEAAV
ncbi:hypothetical protein [Mucilaginibacter pedocola]|uniref:Uncharacterized protein n=1 Tax=Mucilaginibacter pedocola TaxID=1792845 RepID=A0A1S9PK51_9SPHI|nr:hypothetical protein [Mucilaginibacter pedocola]OOQ61343.1 hypothetical protein BC343_20395 [Mucilaginibacter pedocola]